MSENKCSESSLRREHKHAHALSRGDPGQRQVSRPSIATCNLDPSKRHLRHVPAPCQYERGHRLLRRKLYPMRPCFPCHAGRAKPQPNPLRHTRLHHTYRETFLQIRLESVTKERLNYTNVKRQNCHVKSPPKKQPHRRTDTLKLVKTLYVFVPKTTSIPVRSLVPPSLFAPSVLALCPLPPFHLSSLSLLPSPPDCINICELLWRAQCYRPVHRAETGESRTREGRREEEKQIPEKRNSPGNWELVDGLKRIRLITCKRRLEGR